MKPLLVVPLAAICLASTSTMAPLSATAGQAESVIATSAVAAESPSCMKKKTYKKIKKNMRYSKVVDIIKGQDPAFTGPADMPYFIYEGCAWTGGDGILLQYHKKYFTDPLRKAILDRKALNPCGTRPSC